IFGADHLLCRHVREKTCGEMIFKMRVIKPVPASVDVPGRALSAFVNLVISIGQTGSHLADRSGQRDFQLPRYSLFFRLSSVDSMYSMISSLIFSERSAYSMVVLTKPRMWPTS